MIEFISLCVCSACVSYICCLITGGLCLMPCCSRLRLKMMKKHFSEDLHCLGIHSPNGTSDSDTSGSESSLVAGDSARAEKSSRRKSEKNGRKCAKGCPGDGGSVTKKKIETDKSKSKRWTFCLNLKRPAYDPESKKKSKKSRRDRRNDSETHCAYFKSCSCTNVKRRSRRRRSKPFSLESRVDERRSRKQEKSGKQCPCEILTRYDNVVCYDSRDLQSCKCCAKRALAPSRRY